MTANRIFPLILLLLTVALMATLALHRAPIPAMMPMAGHGTDTYQHMRAGFLPRASEIAQYKLKNIALTRFDRSLTSQKRQSPVSLN